MLQLHKCLVGFSQIQFILNRPWSRNHLHDIPTLFLLHFPKKSYQVIRYSLNYWHINTFCGKWGATVKNQSRCQILRLLYYNCISAPPIGWYLLIDILLVSLPYTLVNSLSRDESSGLVQVIHLFYSVTMFTSSENFWRWYCKQ